MTPEIDDSQDVELISGFENGTHTVVTFARPWETCDTKEVGFPCLFSILLALIEYMHEALICWLPQSKISIHFFTCQDMTLGSDTVRLVWSFHPEDPVSLHVLPYHGHQRRGVRSVYLQEMPHEKIDPEKKSSQGQVLTWDLRADSLVLPNDDHTHYWCQVFRLPDHMEYRKHHMIGVSTTVCPNSFPDTNRSSLLLALVTI